MQGTEFTGGEVELLERGVYWQRTLSERGNPIAYAVDSNNRKVKSYEVMHPSRMEMALVTLWDVLDGRDPVPEQRRKGMHLILPATQHRSWVEAFDPYNLPPLAGRARR